MNSKYVVTVNSFIDYGNYHIVHALCSLDDSSKVWLKWQDVISCLRLKDPENYSDMVDVVSTSEFPDIVWPPKWMNQTDVISIDNVKKTFADQYPKFITWVNSTYKIITPTISRIEKKIQSIDNKLTSFMAPSGTRRFLHVHRLDRGRYKFTRGRPSNFHRQIAKIEKKFGTATRFFARYAVLNTENFVEDVVDRLWEKGYIPSRRYNEITFDGDKKEDAVMYEIINELVRCA